MSHLRLVKFNETPIPDKIAEIDARLLFQVLMEKIYDEMIETAEIYRRTYGRSKLLCFGFTKDGPDEVLRFIYDPIGLERSRKGIHMKIENETNMNDIFEQMESAERDGFDTIWVHL